MFRHKGKYRTLKHNLRIASLLSFVAGMVNIVGFLAIHQLTTNVTGHFAFFVDEVYSLNTWRGLVYFLFVLFFLLGSFTSGFLIEFMNRRNERYIFIIPVILEALILLFTGIFGEYMLQKSITYIAYTLLFAMGLQNALVTMISNSVVRTTHLTGLFTDLGIEIAQLFFYKGFKEKTKLYALIKLRSTIIVCFFLGGTLSSLTYSYFGLKLLIFSGFLLFMGLIYDQMRLGLKIMRRKIYQKIR